ncbi:putative transcriptional regulator [Arthrobacter woluwensis]|uniref:BlaI/MecI/CopY family transcriptional regulator n=1 Tax=Arthrobacter woluwensis TaxID=156980 RepID=UPI00277D4F18|nr:BlaI/MecI/CopY family transcriptional regulator [Arthrobacter woluwensis]MDQ0708880.1 putative transcriptional regulator [Arthrobacter woluwensis]
MASLGDLERSVMDLLWAGTEATTANDLRDQLASTDAASGGKELAVTTVLTVLSRLEKKGLVTRERGTRPHRYRAVSTRAEHTAELMREVLGSAPDREAVLATFVGSVSPAEADALRRLLGVDPSSDLPSSS